MAEVYGVVQKITAKDTRNGGKIYNICVDVDGEDEWFGYGFDAPEFGEGSEIEFDVEMNGDYENVDIDSLEIIELVEPKRSGRGGKSGGKGRGKSSGKSSGRGGSSGRGKSSGSGRGKPAGGGRKAPASKGKGGGAAKAEVDWDRKDNLIRLQSCQNTAVATIQAAIEAGAVTLPAKKGEKFDAFQALIEKEAARLYDKYTDIVDGNYLKDEPEDEEEYDEDIPE